VEGCKTRTEETGYRAPADRSKWYAGGLAFECQRSGHCCSGEPGFVWVTKAEIKAIAKILGRPDDWLGKEHLRRAGFRYSLTEKPNGDCVFLVRQGGKISCRIHEAKPTQCQTWPFWSSNLKSPEHWNEAARQCPGMNVGRCRSFAEIEALRKRKPPS